MSLALAFPNLDPVIVNFGPVVGATCHAAIEHVPLDQMVDAACILRDTVDRLLGLGCRAGEANSLRTNLRRLHFRGAQSSARRLDN